MNRRRAISALLAGSAAIGARGVRAQGLARPARVGIVEFGTPPDSAFARGYLAGLRQLGYSEPATLQVERRYARGEEARVAESLQDLARGKVDVAFTVGNDIAQVAKRVAPGLAVVTAGSDDPVLSGLIADYRRPGGNITGITYLSSQLASKRLELLREALPTAARVGVLRDPAHFDTYYQEMERATPALGVELLLVDAQGPGEIDAAIARLQKSRADALFVVPSRRNNLQAKRISELALAARLPMIAAYASFTDAGGFMSYGAIAVDMLARTAAQTDKILRGAKPGDLPFEQASTFELVLNLKTATALGVKVPPAMLQRADRVIE